MHWSKCQHASASTLVTSANTWVTEMLRPRPKPQPASSPKTRIQDPPETTKTSQISSGWSSEDFSQFMVQQDHQTQPISNDHLSFGIPPPTTPKFRRIVKDSHPRRWGGLCFFSQKMAEHISVEFKWPCRWSWWLRAWWGGGGGGRVPLKEQNERKGNGWCENLYESLFISWRP